MTDHKVLAHLDAFPQARVLCCGDLMLDRYVYGAVDRVSPEAPIPVVRVGRESAMMGGVGNVARNVAALGGQAQLVAVTGHDEAARVLADLVDGEPAIAARLVVDSERQTTEKTRYVAAGQQLLRADREDLRPLSGGALAALEEACGEALESAGVVVLSDYAKGTLGEAFLAEVMARAGRAGKPVIADPKSENFTRYRGATLLTPNRRELAAATGSPCDTDDDVTVAGLRVIRDCGVEGVLVTRSEQGMTLVRADRAPLHFGARAREIFDVSGAGDTVVATLATAIAAGAPMEDAAELANLAAGIVVGKVGTATVGADELLDAFHISELLDTERKIVSLGAALEQVERWRQRGLRVGFTNGCFDLVHPGHVSLLNQARAACDRLIVGLNSDESVRRLKGSSRPVQGETARATVLASLGMVDMVVIFSEDTPMRLLEAIRPEVLVKGADYSIDEVVGAGLVQGYGGRVVLADLVSGHSTTGTIAKLTG